MFFSKDLKQEVMIDLRVIISNYRVFRNEDFF